MNRDELARRLYIRGYGEADRPQSRTVAEWQELGARVWDNGDCGSYSYERCYADADRMIANGEVAQ